MAWSINIIARILLGHKPGADSKSKLLTLFLVGRLHSVVLSKIEHSTTPRLLLEWRDVKFKQMVSQS